MISLLKEYGVDFEKHCDGEHHCTCGHQKANDESDDKVRALQKERIKLQTEKIEYNRWLRENARDDLIFEKISDAVKSLTPIAPPAPHPVRHNNCAGVLAMSDIHMGGEFEIRGLDGEVLNSYSPDIAKNRLWNLLDRTIEICEHDNYDEIHVFNLGDNIDGLLRFEQLKVLSAGIVDSTIELCETLAQWLAELSKHVKVHFYMIGGNHDVCRLLQQKPVFKDEDMSKIVKMYIRARLENNPNFEIHENPTGYAFAKIMGYNVLGIHGTCRDLAKEMKDLTALYQIPIDIVLGGHLHYSGHENVGYGMDVIRVPSIIGADNYSLSLRKASNAGAVFLSIEENAGLVMQYYIKLN